MGWFDHQIQDRVEQETVMKRDERQTPVADEMIRSVTGRRVKCDYRRWKGEGRDEDGTGLKRWQRSDMDVIRTYHIVEAALMIQ
jgi:hypothetical protein